MIKELQKTFEYLPKIDGEEDRILSSYEEYREYGFTLRLEIRVDGIRHGCTRTIMNEELNHLNVENEDFILRDLCTTLSDRLKSREGKG